MRIDILTLFPDAVDAMMHASILGRAQERGYITIRTHQIRSFTTNKQMQVDDYPYGGGRGAVMQADPLYRCWAHVCEEAGSRGHTIYLSPCGRTFTQSVARELKETYDHLILVCGHYEGIDQRFIDECVDEEISMGDFVVTGGEIPAMALADAVCRMVPGVLPDEECFTEESHWNGLLEYPQYSRPDEWHGRRVPDVLLSGHHGNVEKWRRKQSYIRTMLRRPDLWAQFDESVWSLHLPMINVRSGVPVCGRDAVFFAALFLGGREICRALFRQVVHIFVEIRKILCYFRQQRKLCSKTHRGRQSKLHGAAKIGFVGRRQRGVPHDAAGRNGRDRLIRGRACLQWA